MRVLSRVLFLVVLLLAELPAAEGDWHQFAAPNKRFAVQLSEGWAIGNCRYNHARLIDTSNGKVLLDFGPEHTPGIDLGGYDEDSVVWSHDSQFVAVYFRSHRVGEPLVARMSGGMSFLCTIPEITLPHEKDHANDGRHAQDWLQPVQWLPDSTLLLTDSGVIQQQREGGFRITYSYNVHFQFDRKDKGILKSVEQRAFSKERQE